MGMSGLSQPLKPRILHFFECRLAKGLLPAFSLGLNSEVRNQKSHFHSDPNITASLCLWMFANLMRIVVTAPRAEVSGFRKSLW
jgi:hypothetical protein